MIIFLFFRNRKIWISMPSMIIHSQKKTVTVFNCLPGPRTVCVKYRRHPTRGPSQLWLPFSAWNFFHAFRFLGWWFAGLRLAFGQACCRRSVAAIVSSKKVPAKLGRLKEKEKISKTSFNCARKRPTRRFAAIGQKYDTVIAKNELIA